MTAALRLTVTVGDAPPRAIDAGPVALVGSGRGADVRIPDSALAPLHLRLARDGDAVIALAAADGVEVDGRPLSLDEPVAVTGRRLTVGSVALVVVPWDAATPAVATDSLARALARELLTGAPPPELVVERGPGAGALRPLPPGARLVIGRGSDADWIILDPELSRRHVTIAHKADGVYAWDAGAKNGATVGGVALPRGEPGRRLTPGERLELGATTLWLRDPATDPGLAPTAPGPGGTATVTRDLRRPAAAAPAPARRRWAVVTAVIAAVAVTLAAIVLATW